MARALGRKARFAWARDCGRPQLNLAVEQQEPSMASPAVAWCDTLHRFSLAVGADCAQGSEMAAWAARRHPWRGVRSDADNTRAFLPRRRSARAPTAHLPRCCTRVDQGRVDDMSGDRSLIRRALADTAICTMPTTPLGGMSSRDRL